MELLTGEVNKLFYSVNIIEIIPVNLRVKSGGGKFHSDCFRYCADSPGLKFLLNILRASFECLYCFVSSGRRDDKIVPVVKSF